VGEKTKRRRVRSFSDCLRPGGAKVCRSKITEFTERDFADPQSTVCRRDIRRKAARGHDRGKGELTIDTSTIEGVKTFILNVRHFLIRQIRPKGVRSTQPSHYIRYPPVPRGVPTVHIHTCASRPDSPSPLSALTWFAPLPLRRIPTRRTPAPMPNANRHKDDPGRLFRAAILTPKPATTPMIPALKRKSTRWKAASASSRVSTFFFVI
jgi:hypothetical protein